LISSRLKPVTLTLSSGVAIYFLSPRWPYDVGAQITLDDDTVSVDLQDHSRPFEPDGGPETVHFDVIWSKEDLSNSTHTLRISSDADARYVVLDALMCVFDMLCVLTRAFKTT